MRCVILFLLANLSMYLIGWFNNMVGPPPPHPNGRGGDGGASVNENQYGGGYKDSVFDQIAFSLHPSLRVLLSPAHACCSTHHYHRYYETNPAISFTLLNSLLFSLLLISFLSLYSFSNLLTYSHHFPSQCSNEIKCEKMIAIH